MESNKPSIDYHQMLFGRSVEKKNCVQAFFNDISDFVLRQFKTRTYFILIFFKKLFQSYFNSLMIGLPAALSEVEGLQQNYCCSGISLTIS